MNAIEFLVLVFMAHILLLLIIDILNDNDKKGGRK